MDDKNRDLVLESINYWKQIAKGKAGSTGVSGCALCREYNKPLTNCYGCPVFSFTGQPYCINTPYKDWAAHHHQAHEYMGGIAPLYVQCDDCRDLAVKQVDFLESLLPDVVESNAGALWLRVKHATFGTYQIPVANVADAAKAAVALYWLEEEINIQESVGNDSKSGVAAHERKRKTAVLIEHNILDEEMGEAKTDGQLSYFLISSLDLNGESR